MCTKLQPPGVNPTSVNKYTISYQHIISCIIYLQDGINTQKSRMNLAAVPRCDALASAQTARGLRHVPRSLQDTVNQ